jgi:lysophospholipase L1-like esterase
VKRLILFEGVNDLGMSFGRADGPLGRFLAMMPDRRVSAAQVIAGYRQIIERARARGIKVYGATITPFKGATYWSPEGEAARQEVNRFIRSGAFDAVLDFDKVMADPADPQSIRAGFHMGDHLHGSDAGYKAMGESVDLGLFDR